MYEAQDWYLMCSMVWMHSPIGSKDLSWWCIFNPAKPSLYQDTWLNKMVDCCWIIEALCTNYWHNHIIKVWFCGLDSGADTTNGYPTLIWKLLLHM